MCHCVSPRGAPSLVGDPDAEGVTMQIAGKVVVVTGGGNGIGRDVVLELLARRASVAAVDLRGESLAETAGLAPAGHGKLSTHTVDVSDRAAVEALVADVLAAHGQVDGVVNVAGIIQPFVPFNDLPYEQMEKVVGVNFWGVVHLCKAFLPHLLERPEACLVNVSSMGAFVPVPGQTVYGASKAAVKLLTEGLYAELRGTHVRVTAVYPGATGTDISAHSGVTVPGQGAATSKMAQKMTSSVDAAHAIVGAIETGPYRVLIGGDTRMLDRLSRLVPRRATDLVAKRMKSLLER
jgi:NAD(P)-dependent dehydrogenase (short-subunit alcohol dehydrogenase family)